MIELIVSTPQDNYFTPTQFDLLVNGKEVSVTTYLDHRQNVDWDYVYDPNTVELTDDEYEEIDDWINNHY